MGPPSRGGPVRHPCWDGLHQKGWLHPDLHADRHRPRREQGAHDVGRGYGGRRETHRLVDVRHGCRRHSVRQE